MFKSSLVALMTLTLVACGASAGGPPEIQVDRTACSHCTMLISEPRHAAAYQAPGQEARVFDDIGCLLNAARSETTGPLRFWFHDVTDATWIDGTDATFVSSPDIRTPMSGGLAAYRSRGAAEQAAKELRGQVIPSVEALFARKDGGS